MNDRMAAGLAQFDKTLRCKSPARLLHARGRNSGKILAIDVWPKGCETIETRFVIHSENKNQK